MCVTAAPSSELSRMRRRLLPTVVPKPRSKGSAVKRAYVSVESCSSRTTREGSSKPLQRILMSVAPCARRIAGSSRPDRSGPSVLPPRRANAMKLVCLCSDPRRSRRAPAREREPCGSAARDSNLNAPLLRRTAPVVRQRRDVLDAGDLQAGVLHLEDRLLAAGAGALDLDLDLDHAVLARLVGGLLSGASGGERRALARALEPDRPGRAPRDRLPVGVRDRDHRVVERRLDVRHATRHALAELLLRPAGLARRFRCACCFGHCFSFLRGSPDLRSSP